MMTSHTDNSYYLRWLLIITHLSASVEPCSRRSRGSRLGPDDISASFTTAPKINLCLTKIVCQAAACIKWWVILLAVCSWDTDSVCVCVGYAQEELICVTCCLIEAEVYSRGVRRGKSFTYRGDRLTFSNSLSWKAFVCRTALCTRKVMEVVDWRMRTERLGGGSSNPVSPPNIRPVVEEVPVGLSVWESYRSC